jgi:serine/threonine protein kinase
MPLASNQQLFEYRIVSVLGQGAFGIVYLAHDTLLDRRVAIKELTVTAQTDEVAFKRFIQEARAAGGLNHPHIVTVYALKVVEPNVYLVMEYLAGGSLRTLLEERGSLPVEEAVRIAADVCEGLAAAHAKGIVHRDVKPENILLAEDGRAKIGDFGIARVPQAMGGYTMTGTGFQPGTLPYMSPEQVRGQRVDERSDVYGVGVVLYEMLTGQPYVDVDALGRRAWEMAGSNVMLFQARLYELLAEAVCEWEPEGVCRVSGFSEIPERLERMYEAAGGKWRDVF